jgi:hypothetical protein
MNWFQKNFKTIIYTSFLIPIILVALVSISHVTQWYGISNPISWAIYLSVGIEIAALSALAAISAKMGKKVYFPFGIVTLIQFIGNIFFAYQYIDINSESFKDWVDLVDPIVSYLGVESGDPVGHKRFLALFSGGMLPLISLSFLHMLVKFEEDEKKNTPEVKLTEIDIDELSIKAGKMEADLENEKWVPTEEDLKKFEQMLKIQDFVEPQQPLSEEFEPHISDDFQVGSEGAYEHTEDETTNNLSFESQIVEEQEINEPIIEIPEEILPHNLKPMDENLPTIDLVEPEENPDVPKINRLTYTNRNE